MLNKLDYKKKQLLLIVGTVITLYVSYQLSFEKAISAYQLNKSLEIENVSASRLPGSYVQMEKQDDFYKSIIKSYKVGKTDRENFLWQRLSALAVASRVDINYTREKDVEVDSTAVVRGVVSDAFTFSGNYHDLIKLLDTISKSQGIGRISSLTLSTNKKAESEKKEVLSLNVKINGIMYNDNPDGIEN